MPEAPDHLKQTRGSDSWSQILLLGGEMLGLIVEDRYGNPIANQVVSLTSHPPENLASCENPGFDPSPALLVAGDDPCAATFPSHGGSCGNPTLTLISDYRGASAQVIVGPMPEALYRITASVVGLPTVEFKRRSLSEVDCRNGDRC